jgi:hypothetical protein
MSMAATVVALLATAITGYYAWLTRQLVHQTMRSQNLEQRVVELEKAVAALQPPRRARWFTR